jgi:hypothetical protein
MSEVFKHKETKVMHNAGLHVCRRSVGLFGMYKELSVNLFLRDERVARSIECNKFGIKIKYLHVSATIDHHQKARSTL